MAEYYCMVSRSARYKIAAAVLAVACVFTGVLAVRSAISAASVRVYAASNAQLDLAVVDGIAKADRATSTPAAGPVRAVVVPHHMVAAEAIALGIKALVPSAPRTVVVISPDHFGHCLAMVCTTQGSYHTFFGNADISEPDVAELLRHTDFVASSDLFTEEHGVYSIVPFIKHYLPDAKIAPIAVSYGRGNEKERADMVSALRALLQQKDVALVISSDFSHYLPLAEADAMDRQTQAAFCSGSADEILRFRNPDQSDCPLCLWLLREEAELGVFWNPTLLWHSNSATLLGDATVKSTTSHFVFELSDAPAPPGSCAAGNNASTTPPGEASIASSTLSILFTGDMNFDRYIRRMGDVHGSAYLFSCADALLKSADFVVGNLEGPITAAPSVSEGTVIGTPNNYRFTFPTTTAGLLADHGIRVVDMGNNHVGNMGPEGVASTRRLLDAAGVGYFGGLGGDEPVYRMEEKGLQLSFVSYNQFGGNAPEKVAQTIAEERAAGRTVIVFAHWGTEYSVDVSQIRPIATLFAHAGAAAVIGAHPHIVLTHEYIGTTLVYYSLGNFIFDQYWDSNVTHGLTVLLKFVNGQATAQEFPVRLQPDGRTCPV